MFVRRRQRRVGVLFPTFCRTAAVDSADPYSPHDGVFDCNPPRLTACTLASDTVVVGDEFPWVTPNINSRSHLRVWKCVIGGGIQRVPRWCSDNNRQKPET